jgi:hypothetical protein
MSMTCAMNSMLFLLTLNFVSAKKSCNLVQSLVFLVYLNSLLSQDYETRHFFGYVGNRMPFN